MAKTSGKKSQEMKPSKSQPPVEMTKICSNNLHGFAQNFTVI